MQKTTKTTICVLLLLLAAGAGAHNGESHGASGAAGASEAPVVLAPGYHRLQFEPPAPGSYALPALKAAADGEILRADGSAARLYDFLGDKLVLLSFVYTSCSDINGCPLATAVFAQIMQRIGNESPVSENVRLLTLSFDPANDKPEVMANYGTHFRNKRVEWRFLTTESDEQLNPILNAYDQSIRKEYDDNGKFMGSFSHILRVYLIDRERRIRNIYSVSFLHADTLINDIKTLLLEDDPGDDSATSVVASSVPSLHGAGDDKKGYESEAYVTRSRDLNQRTGQPADLLDIARTPQLGLPDLPVPADNPLTAPRIGLGRKLFFDRRLSLNDTFSCAMCHIPEQGFTSNELATAVGIEGRTVRRNSPTLYNVGYLRRLFHDARETTLEQQVWAPILARNEMGNPSIGYVIEKIRGLADYDRLFEEAFDGRGPTMETIGMALAAYQRALVSGASAFDRWYYAGEAEAMSSEAQRGYSLFTGKAGCASCHTIGSNHALFTDQRMHNTGIGYRQSMGIEPETRRVQLAPGVFADVDTASYKAAAERPPADLGLYEITQDPADRWRYRTPSLRNVALTAPYMHDGSLKTLRDVVDFYNRGGVPNENLDPLMRPLGLGEGEVADVVSFLESLTGANIDVLLADAFSAPIGDRDGEEAE